jgi:DNA-binding MarR family transcriptional regulator
MTQSDVRKPISGLLSEAKRVSARLKTIFVESWRDCGLNESELMVLTAVITADRPPTAPQIGRSQGYPRQIVQRAANALIAQGLVETAPNPDHKRAVLLKPTARGIALKGQCDVRSEEIAAQLVKTVDLDAVLAATASLHTVRRQLEAYVRQQNN